MTIDLTRKVGVMQARQGGFSVVVGLAQGAVVPGAPTAAAPAPVVPYVPANNELVIYYSPTEGLTEPPGSTVEWYPRSGTAFDTGTFRGGLTLSPTGGGYPGGWLDVYLDDPVIGTEDFTYEVWANVGADELDLVGISLFESGVHWSYIELAVADGVATSKIYFLQSGDPSSYNSGRVEMGSIGVWTHLCVQRIAGILHYHFDGSPISYTATGAQTAVNISSAAYIEIEVRSEEAVSEAGQARVTFGSGIYGAGSFTPPSGLFYSP